MSEPEEENFCFFGKPLDPYDEDAFPKKRPITVEEQIATDAQGRRRFHGAFTGGFSAGFYNTVGSLEGWLPSEFKSTRQDKARNVVQKPEDFMDEEDIGEYGIAPQTVRATKDYSTSKKRRKQVYADGPIPGTPVLETLLTSGNETIGYLLLKNLGIQDKIQKQLEETGVSNVKVYGCHMPIPYKIPDKIENKQYIIPDIYTEFLNSPKANTFGLGYQGLDRAHVNLFTKSNLVVRDKNNKKFSIGGQAFGVGAFEEDDDDIYVKEDMSNYDFEMKKEKDGKVKRDHGNLLFGMFKHLKAPVVPKKLYPPPTIPQSFSGKHKVKKSRFEAIVEVKEEEVDRRTINPAIRAKYLGEEVQETYTPSKPAKESSQTNSKENNTASTSRNSFDVSSLMSDRFVSASIKEEASDILEPVKKSETTHGTKDMREAARMNMFGPLTRVTTDWHPCSCLCKRFNVPEPFMDRPEEKKKRTKNLIFENPKLDEEDSSFFKPGISTESPTPQESQIQTDENMDISETNIQEPDIPIKTEVQENLTEDPKDTEKEENDSAPADITDKIGIEEKTDLFKAVFLSSSESEDEEEEEAVEEDIDKTEEFKESILNEQLLPKIKPLKEGILSNLSFHPFSKPKLEEKAPEDKTPEVTSNSSDPVPDTSYGPLLPSEKIVAKSLKDISKVSSDSGDEWVERDRKKSKHKKKNKKKDKHKEKKSKKSHKSKR
ncbi:hypothetical protein JTB14_034180 [Gonioctena quinquepunctata]|nr:hypothetical protein JTB14_034180 [Gonioctena quinquepunctata]